MKIAYTGNTIPFGEGMHYGGERVLYYMIQGLSAMGHDIYLFAPDGCKIPEGTVKDYTITKPWDGQNDFYFEAVSQYCRQHKIVFDLYSCNYFGNGWNPIVSEIMPYVEITWCRWCHQGWQLNIPPFNVVSYSKILQQDFLEANPAFKTTMIHFGIPKDLYQFEPEHEDYAVFIGKIETGKATGMAIKLARAAGLKIVVMGPPYNMGHFREEVLPYLNDPGVIWVRGVDDAQKRKIMSKAKVFISSNQGNWKEHFGMVNTEALAMGVPVIGFNQPAMPSAIQTDGIIEDGKHGFILNYDVDEPKEAIIERGIPLVDQIGQINRVDCRNHFEKHFTSELTAKRYGYMYEKVADGGRFGELEIPF